MVRDLLSGAREAQGNLGKFPVCDDGKEQTVAAFLGAYCNSFKLSLSIQFINVLKKS